MTKNAKDKSLTSIGGLLLTIGLLCFAGAKVYVFYFESTFGPTMGAPDVFLLLLLGVGTISTGLGGGLYLFGYRLACENMSSYRPLGLVRVGWLVRVGLLLLGIGAVIFTIDFVFADIEFRRQHGLHLNIWNIVLQWPLLLYDAFSNPSFLSRLPFMAYIRILIVCISPLLALSAIRKLEYPIPFHAPWFALALLFPFLLLVLAIMPRYSPEIGRRFATAGELFLGGIFGVGVGLFFLITQDSGDIVYIAGARWFGTDNPAVTGLMVIVGFLFGGLGIVGIVSAILVALGILKMESL